MTHVLSVGSTLDGERYRVLRVLGGGGEGAVYLVEDTGVMAKRWAIKEMHEHQLQPDQRAEAVKRFQAEATLLANLNHRNLPNVVRYFSERGREYLVMEYVAGQTLEAVIQAHGGPLPEPQVFIWAAQLCDVLEYLHQHEPPIIFRDLSPDNILVQPDDTIKLIDFGIARHFDPGKHTDTLKMGKIGYAPPEQYGGGGQTTPRSDVYALGAVISFLLTGRDPSDQPFVFPPAQTINPQISAATSKILAQAVEYNPDARFATIGDFRRALLGTGQLRFCHHCGTPNRGISKFCARCGQPLVPTQPTPPQQPQPGRREAERPRARRSSLRRLAIFILVGTLIGVVLGVLPGLVTPGVLITALPPTLYLLTIAGTAFFGLAGVALGLRFGRHS